MDKALFDDLVESLNEMVEIETTQKSPKPEQITVYKIDQEPPLSVRLKREGL